MSDFSFKRQRQRITREEGAKLPIIVCTTLFLLIGILAR